MNPEDVPEELLSLYGRNYMGSSSKVAARRAMAAVIPEIEKRVREQVAAELREDAEAHRRVVERKPTEHDAARLARARTLDDAAARITRWSR